MQKERTIKHMKTYYLDNGDIDGFEFHVKGVTVNIEPMRFCPQHVSDIHDLNVSISTTRSFSNDGVKLSYNVWIQPADSTGKVIHGEGYCEEENTWDLCWVLQLYRVELVELPDSESTALEIAIEHTKRFLNDSKFYINLQ